MLRSHMLEVSSGGTPRTSLMYVPLRRRGVCELSSGGGTVTNVVPHQPWAGAPRAVVMLHGCFEILSLTGTVLSSPGLGGGILISLSLGQGQAVGGSLVVPLVVSGTVVLMAVSFANAVFERLPLEVGGAITAAQLQPSVLQSSGAGGSGQGGHMGESGGGGGGGGDGSFLNSGGGGWGNATPLWNYLFSAEHFGWGSSGSSSRGSGRPPFLLDGRVWSTHF
ncbi:AT-hook motif nuclear-localized protein 25-like [Salvia miltiorrhiza]|uniref:AT-hook motif nuclear-localized protein 25-like n=1 Tax=Salvia miltiorrhiza TaxID=226208 RepID=UPI0025ACB5B0|nr:AT-hook motif nuclear-localized protein 25-like [Salvia miltiorrhiza]